MKINNKLIIFLILTLTMLVSQSCKNSNKPICEYRLPLTNQTNVINNINTAINSGINIIQLYNWFSQNRQINLNQVTLNFDERYIKFNNYKFKPYHYYANTMILDKYCYRIFDGRIEVSFDFDLINQQNNNINIDSLVDYLKDEYPEWTIDNICPKITGVYKDNNKAIIANAGIKMIYYF